MAKNRQDLLAADQYKKYLGQQTEITRQIQTGKLTTDQLQALIEGRNPFDPSLFTKTVDLIQARQILGKASVMGPEEIYKAFGVVLAPEQIPDIPFNLQDLKNAKRLNQFLVLRIDRRAKKIPLTIQNLHSSCQPTFTENKYGRILYSIDWYKNEEFYTTTVSRPGWYLVDRHPVKKSLDNKNFSDQTKLIVEYLTKEIFANDLPEIFRSAIREFEQAVYEIDELMKTNWQATAKRFADLSINNLCRRTPVEIVYDFLIVFFNNKERLLEKYYDWTSSLDADGYLVYVGGGAGNGLSVSGSRPGLCGPALGWCLSWTCENRN